MKRILFLTFFLSLMAVRLDAQELTTTVNGFLVPAIIQKGDTIPLMQLPTVYVYKPCG